MDRRNAAINGLMAALSLGSVAALFGASWWFGWSPFILLVPVPAMGAIWLLAGLQKR